MERLIQLHYAILNRNYQNRQKCERGNSKQNKMVPVPANQTHWRSIVVTKGLKFVEIEEAPEEIRRWQPKAALEVSGKNHYFPWIQHGL
jgi:hypothetical protein